VPSPAVSAHCRNLPAQGEDDRLHPGVDRHRHHVHVDLDRHEQSARRTVREVTATGQLVYVAGPSLSAATLADLLARAGSVRAMELDINPEWTSFSYYVPGPTGAPTATKLLASMQRPANRYESTSTRDFLGVLAR